MADATPRLGWLQIFCQEVAEMRLHSIDLPIPDKKLAHEADWSEVNIVRGELDI